MKSFSVRHWPHQARGTGVVTLSDFNSFTAVDLMEEFHLPMSSNFTYLPPVFKDLADASRKSREHIIGGLMNTLEETLPRVMEG